MGIYYNILYCYFVVKSVVLCVTILCNSTISLYVMYNYDVIVNLFNYKTSKFNETFHLELSLIEY